MTNSYEFETILTKGLLPCESHTHELWQQKQNSANQNEFTKIEQTFRPGKVFLCCCFVSILFWEEAVFFSVNEVLTGDRFTIDLSDCSSLEGIQGPPTTTTNWIKTKEVYSLIFIGFLKLTGGCFHRETEVHKHMLALLLYEWGPLHSRLPWQTGTLGCG